jgi:hypothetical protein
MLRPLNSWVLFLIPVEEGGAIPSQWAGIIFNTCVEERGVVGIIFEPHHRQVLF